MATKSLLANELNHTTGVERSHSYAAFTLHRRRLSKQEAPLPQRAQRVRRALVYFMTFIGRQTTDQQLINHLYETGHETYRIPRINAK